MTCSRPGTIPRMGGPCRGTPLPEGQHFVPAGMCARLVAENVGGLRQIAFGPDGDLFGVTGGGSIRLFHDANGDGAHDMEEVVIERGNPLPAGLRLTGNSSIARYMSFVANGATRLASGGFQAGTIVVCNVSATGGEARQIVLNAFGRPRVERVAVAACA